MATRLAAVVKTSREIAATGSRSTKGRDPGVKTKPGEGYLAAIRRYGPTQPFFHQTWIPDDVIKIS